jgi:hypothetical protein
MEKEGLRGKDSEVIIQRRTINSNYHTKFTSEFTNILEERTSKLKQSHTNNFTSKQTKIHSREVSQERKALQTFVQRCEPIESLLFSLDDLCNL